MRCGNIELVLVIVLNSMLAPAGILVTAESTIVSLSQYPWRGIDRVAMNPRTSYVTCTNVRLFSFLKDVINHFLQYLKEAQNFLLDALQPFVVIK